MPYTQPHLRLTFGGSIGTAEQWSTGLRFLTSTEPGTTALEDLFERTYQFLTADGVAMCNYVRLGWLKVALLDVDGQYPPDFEALLYESEPPLAGSGQTGYPPQCSTVVTLETGVSRGRAHRGRMYLPPCTTPIQADGRMSAVQAEQASLAAASWLDDMTDLMIAPAVVMSKLGAGTTRTINAVSVGRVVDTQRSRRRSLPEDRVTSLLNP